MLRQQIQNLTEISSTQMFVLIGANLLFNIIANASFNISALSQNWSTFLSWQVVGNLAGLITVLTLTGLLRFIPLHIAYTVTAGLAVIGVQVVAAKWIFGEVVSATQWLGTFLVIAGILIIGWR
jgi:multidrug transporter EmrE-like cation transporter